jgi:tetratricopeptide (TPR) repeat protein
MKDDAGTVDAAEQLWHFADEHGFSRHDPHDYLPDVLAALYRLDRTNETLIWLERLVKWQQQELEVDEANLPDDALAARLAVAVYLAMGGHADAAGLTARLRALAEHRSNYPVIYRTASACYYLGWHDDARAWYERALAINSTLPETQRYETAILETRIAECREAVSASAQSRSRRKAWWKFWQ